MKKVKSAKKKLVLVRTTIRPLHSDQLQQIVGGHVPLAYTHPTN